MPSRAQLERVLRYLFDEQEFLSPVRRAFAVDVCTKDQPYVFHVHGDDEYRVDYTPGESTIADVRRQQQLARADLVPDQLPADRSARTLRAASTATTCRSSVPAGSGQLRQPATGRRRTRASPDAAVSGALPMAVARSQAMTGASPTTRTTGTSTGSTSTSTAIPVAVAVPATRPVGPRWSRAASLTGSTRGGLASPRPCARRRTGFVSARACSAASAARPTARRRARALRSRPVSRPAR